MSERSATGTLSLNSKSVALVALGCSKNMVDAEMILGRLLEQGARLTSHSHEADLVVINTCSFIGPAKEESVEAIVSALDSRQEGQKIMVTGCLSQRYGEELLSELPEIDALLGINAPRDIVDAAAGLFADSGESCHSITAATREYGTSHARFLLTPKHHAYLRIADGCDQGCRFCAIPRIRGRQRSRTLDDVVAEARQLVEQGVRELNLVAHDLTSYGVDLGDEPRLSNLLRALNDVDGVDWIRTYYIYPRGVGDDFVQAMADCDKVLPYVDMPLQHISDHVLSAMNRRITRKETEELLGRFESLLNNPVFRTTMLVGYPGETEEDFQELLDFVAEKRFTHLGAFAYSPEEGTAAFHRDGQVDEEVARNRLDRLMALQQSIAFDLQDLRLGQSVKVVVDGFDETNRLVCRSWQEGPEGDSLIFLPGAQAEPGSLIEVTLTEREDYDLIASSI